MTRFTIFSHAFGLSAVAAILAACGGSEGPVNALVTSQVRPFDGRPSTTASGNDFIYVSQTGQDYGTLVLSYPTGKKVTKIKRVLGPMCTDPNTGNVYIIDETTIREYAPGKKQPIGSLTLEIGEPSGCAVDPTSGDLAVTVNGFSVPPWVAVYQTLSSSPEKYVDRRAIGLYFCGFDSQGNLFVDGYSKHRRDLLAELPVGANKITKISVDLTISVGPVQWDGTYITVENPISAPKIYRIAVSGSKGTVVGVTKLGRRSGPYPAYSWIQGDTVIAPFGPSSENNIIGYWHYPKGGHRPYKMIKNLSYAQYVLVSEPSTRTK
jgi:hypothetical protein